MRLGLSLSITRAGVAAASAKIVETFRSLSSFTLVQGASSTISLSQGDGVLAADCINFSATTSSASSATATENLNPDLDLSGVAGFWLLARVNFRQTAAQVGITAYLSLADDLAGGSGRWSAGNIINAAAVSVQPHWVPKTKFAVLDGSPSFSTPIKSWRFRIDSSTTGEVHDWDLLGVTIRERTRPTVVITNDDGWDTDYSVAFPAAQSRGIPLTHYLIASTLHTAGYMTLSNAQEMQAAGDCLGLHGVADWDADTTRITSDKEALVALGLPADHAAYPEGAIGNGTTWQATTAALAAAGVKTARLAGGNTPTLRHRTDSMALMSYPLSSSTTLAQAKAAIDTAIESNGTVIFYGHKYGATADSLTWATADFTALLDYIVSKRNAGLLDTKTIAQWWGA